MKLRVLLSTTAAACLLSATLALGQASNNSLLSGNYTFEPSGSAELDNKRGNCDAKDTVAAALSGTLNFDGNGNITAVANEVTTSLGANYCTGVNHTLTGKYNVVTVGASSFKATGTFTIPPGVSGGRVVRCDLVTIVDVPFTIVGSVSDGSYTITTLAAGPGSTYAEGPLRGVRPLARRVSLIL
jgi:hypothetical protein